MFSLLKRVHIAKKGSYIGGNNTPVVLDDKTMSEVAETYEVDNHSAPTVLGHKSQASPCWGWVESVTKEGDDLYADIKVADKLREWMKLSLYKKRSASFYLPDAEHNPTPGKLHLRHLALLGAEPPVIKGLEDIANLSEDNFEKYGFGIVNLSEHKDEVFEVIEQDIESINALIDAAESADLSEDEVVDELELEDATMTGDDEAADLAEDSAEDEDTADLAEKTSKGKVEEAEDEADDEDETAEMAEKATAKDAAKAVEGKGKDNSEYIDKNIGKWLRFLLSDGNKGYKDEITKFDPMPSKANNWLLNAAGTEFKGVFMDESYDEPKVVEFTLTKNGTTWTRSFGLKQDDAELAEEMDETTEVKEPAKAPAKAKTPVKAADMSEDKAKDKVADMSEDSHLDEVRALKAQIAQLQQGIRQKEVADFSEGLYADGILLEGVFPQDKFIALVSSLEHESQTVELSEGEFESPFSLFKQLTESLPKQVLYDVEIAPTDAKQQNTGHVDLSEMSSAPVGTMNDEAGYMTHMRAIQYCQANDLDPLNTDNYMSAIKATLD